MFTGPIHKIEAEISQSRKKLSALPRYHPLRPICASRLGFWLLESYWLSKQKDDLDKAIMYLAESLLSPPVPWLAWSPINPEVLFELALSLLVRSRDSKEPEDAIYAAIYLRYLRDSVYKPFVFRR